MSLNAQQRPYLQTKPSKCVALRKGQVCYQKLSVVFAASSVGDYCIHLADESTPLKCWNNVSEGKFSYELKARQSVEFQLKMLSGELITNSHFTVSWVYKNRSRQRSGWRIF